MRNFFKRFKFLLLGLAVALMAYTGVNTWSFPYGGNQIIARGDAVALQANGKIVWNTNPGWVSTDGTGMTINDVNTYVNGCSLTGTYGSNQLATNSQVQGCAVVTSTISGTTDPWLINSGTSWPTQSGSPTFTADSSGLSGEPAGAHFVSSPTTSATTERVWQAINGGSSLLVNTTITATAQLEATSATSGSALSGCTAATATGSAIVEILNSSGTIEAQSSTVQAASWTSASATYTVTTAGVYYVAVYASTATASGTHWNGSTCIASAAVYGYGKGIDINVSN